MDYWQHNLADLLTKKHELSMESVTLNSVWQSGLPWMRLDTKNIPLLALDQLRVEKLIEDEVRVECFDDAMSSHNLRKVLFTFQILSLSLLLVRPGCRSTC